MKYNSDSHTFVICAYQTSPYLEACILSLVNQEILTTIIMVTSTPNEMINELSRQYDIKLFVSNGRTSLAADWNFAVSCAKTPLVTIVHQDDIYERQYAKQIIAKCNRVSRPLLLFTDSYVIRDGRKQYRNSNLTVKRLLLLPLQIPLFSSSIFIRRRVLSAGNPICCPSVTMVMSRIKKPVFTDSFKSNTDWQAWEKISKEKGEFIYIHKQLIGHRIHAHSTTTQIIRSNIRTKEDYAMFCRFWPKAIARFLVALYRLGEKSNQVGSQGDEKKKIIKEKLPIEKKKNLVWNCDRHIPL